MLSIFGGSKPQQWKSINSIEGEIRTQISQIPKIELRPLARILIIDDKPFTPKTNLENNKYHLTYISEIKDIKIVEPYDIILSDLQGVGHELNNDLHGAHVIREIKENFPAKIVIAYSGIAKNKEMSRVAAEHADQFIKKDASIDEWIEELDKYCNIALNPVSSWKKIRARMLDSGVTPEQLMQLEDKFVRGIEGRDKNIQNNLEQSARVFGVSDEIRALIRGVVTGGIIKLFMG